MSLVVRASTFLRRAGLRRAIFCSNVVSIDLYSFASRAADFHAAAGLKCPVRRTAGLTLISAS